MTFFALTHNDNLYAKACAMLDMCFGCKGGIEIDFSGAKPALGGAYAGVYDFSIAHSGEAAAIAVSDKKIGCDIEIFKGKEHSAVASRFTGRERENISCERDFIINWTAKEAYIKRRALALATHLKRLEFFDDAIWLDGRRQPDQIVHLPFDGGIACVCGDCDIKITEI